ncbi:MAG: DUF2306 domain-containing protein [Crocinitomicaceae bacterium]|nr:DUF2306 domain-containing protein [Crocinitomicaceae bacterium]
MKLRKTYWIVFVTLAVLVGLYPISYWITDMSGGLLSEKSLELLSSRLYNLAFYVHISTGGVALLIGWAQFAQKFRLRKPKAHITIGKTYIVSVLLSGLAGLYISFYATGGLVTIMGFSALSILWLSSTIMGYLAVRRKEFIKHRNWMLRSYALAFAAVTLRIWMIAIPALFPIEPSEAYKLVSWICWVPNLYVVELLIHNRLNIHRKV